MTVSQPTTFPEAISALGVFHAQTKTHEGYCLLRVVTWNCNGAFRKKFHLLDSLEADLLVIQECEDPERTKDREYQSLSSNCLWVGPTKNKGLGIFARKDVTLTRVHLDIAPLELFLPCLINKTTPLLATWTRHANSPNFGYIGQLWKFLQKEKSFLANSQAMLVGDLNSNKRWDEWDKWWNHTDVVQELSGLGMRSAYHEFFGEPHGEESRPTLYFQRKIERPYHIDYGFFGTSWKLTKVSVGESTPWLQYSDHMPVIFNLA